MRGSSEFAVLWSIAALAAGCSLAGGADQPSPLEGADPTTRSSTITTPVAPQPDRPRVHVIATGGTISNTDDDGRLTGEQIVARVPGVDELAELTVEQFSNIPSGRMTPELWLDLARRVEAEFAADPDLAGIVITHGTDTIEETAYFLDLTVDDPRPVLLTGAMRNASRLSDDGPANFYNAVRVATSEEARGRGAMVVMNDVALPAREATKMNTSRVEAFEAGRRGPLAILDPDAVVFLEPALNGAAERDRAALIDVEAVDRLPRVDIVIAYAGADGALIDAAVAAGAQGVVTAGVGRGGLAPGQYDAVDRALEGGVWVVNSSRTQGGRVPVGSDERRLEDWEDGEGLRLGASDLTPQKARILLMLALAETNEPARVLQIFRTR